MVLAFDALPARADDGVSPETLSDLRNYTVEQLMDIEVTSVTKAPEPLADSPSAVQVITNEAIARSGATSLPEALRLADNLEVAQENSHDWAISSRGFNANLANKLLVLIDGRAVYSPLYGGVLWNVQDTMLADVDRIEVVSGPGGTLWGANAVNGVINVTTKSAKDTQGLYLEAGSGSADQAVTAVRYGGKLAPNIYGRIYGSFTDHRSEVMSNGSRVSDSYRMGRSGFRVDDEVTPEKTLTVQGDAYSGSENEGSTGEARLGGANLLGRWSRTMADGSSQTLQVYFDRTHLAQPFAASPATPPYFSGFPAASLIDDLDTYDLSYENHATAGSSRQVTWGLGYRRTHEFDSDLSIVRFVPEGLDRNLFSGFVQDEISLGRRARLTLGTKLEHNDYTGWETEPSARLQFTPRPGHFVWTAVSRAVRTPSRYDRDLEVVSGLINAPAPYQFPTDYIRGGSDFVSEKVLAYEAGYRAALSNKVTGSLSVYYNDYSDLRSTTATATTSTYIFPFPVYFENNLEGDTYGAELSGDYQLLPWWRLHAGYDRLKEHLRPHPGTTDGTGGLNETADPGEQWSLRSAVDLPQRIQLDAALRWVGAFTINSGPTSGPVAGTVPSYRELDLQVSWQATERLELALVGQNLLHAHHPEYGFPGSAREEIQRSVFGKAVWRF